MSLFACKSRKKNDPAKLTPSVKTFTIDKKLDSVFEAEEDSISLDEQEANKTGNALVKFLSAAFVSKKNSTLTDIEITYNNVSRKAIAAIQFRWTGINSLGKPADVGQTDLNDAGGGVEQDTLAAGKKQTSIWEISSKDGKKITKSWAHEVVFSDGTKWAAIK